jgi:hypothetical protein
MIRFGGMRQFTAWRLYQLSEDQFDKLKYVYRRAKNQEAAQKIYQQELAFRFLRRSESPFCRASFKPSYEDISKVRDYLKTGIVDAQTYLEVDPRVNAIHSKLQRLSEMLMRRGYSASLESAPSPAVRLYCRR